MICKSLLCCAAFLCVLSGSSFTVGYDTHATYAPTDVVTFHTDNARLGWDQFELWLTPSNLKSGRFRQRWHAPLDGMVPGSPLYLHPDRNSGVYREMVFAGTSANSVWALDAATGKTLWVRKRLAEPLNEAQFTGSWFGRGDHGILSTPVIDTKTSTLYACVVRAKGLRQYFEVWALDIRDGTTRPGWPVTIRASYHGKAFAAGEVMQRGALSFVNGWIYAPFGGRWDTPPWRGWLIGIDTNHPHAPQRAYCASPYTDGGGIWSGGGAAADDNTGEIFASTGNGEYDYGSGGLNMGESVVRLRTRGAAFFSGKKADYYTPSNFKFLDDEDEDLGGCSPLVLPDQPGTSTPHVIFTCGKDGLAYLLNRDNLGGIGGEIMKQRLFSLPQQVYHEGIRSTAAYVNLAERGQYLFVAGDEPGPDNNKGMIALRLTTDAPGGPLRFKKVWTLPVVLNGPSSPVVSSAGTQNAIVWVVETNDGQHSSLHAYDALTGESLYDSNAARPEDAFDGGQRFTSPIVADGSVFVPAQGILCFSARFGSGGAR